MTSIHEGRSGLGSEVKMTCGENLNAGLFLSKIGEVEMLSESEDTFNTKLMDLLRNFSCKFCFFKQFPNLSKYSIKLKKSSSCPLYQVMRSR